MLRISLYSERMGLVDSGLWPSIRLLDMGWPFRLVVLLCLACPSHVLGGLKVLATTRRPDFKPPTSYYCSRFVILFCKPAAVDHTITVAGHIIRRDWVSRNVPLSHLSLLFSGRQQRNTQRDEIPNGSQESQHTLDIVSVVVFVSL